jgi:hypothetical protein
MKIIKKFTFATLAALAATLLFPTSITRADEHGSRGDDNDYDPVLHWNQVFIDTITRKRVPPTP